MPFDLSVVVATRNRAECLPPTLESLERLEPRLRWELILVDNASTDATAEVLRAFAGRARMPLRVLTEPLPGAARARNLGWRHAEAPVVAFTDDDCYPAPDWLDRLSDCFRRDTIGFAGGRILLHDPTDYAYTIMERTDPFDLPAGEFVTAGAIQGANWAVRRVALEQAGGFDPELGPGTPWVCEEVELQARLSAAGWLGTYDPHPLVYHHHRRKTLEEFRAVEKGYARGRGAYHMKGILNPGMRREWARRWYWAIRSQPLRTTTLEVMGAVSYLIRRPVAR